jgi:hypothetical protein
MDRFSWLNGPERQLVSKNSGTWIPRPRRALDLTRHLGEIDCSLKALSL